MCGTDPEHQSRFGTVSQRRSEIENSETQTHLGSNGVSTPGFTRGSKVMNNSQARSFWGEGGHRDLQKLQSNGGDFPRIPCYNSRKMAEVKLEGTEPIC